MPVTFDDRRDAGQRLAHVLVDRQLASPVVLALPRGGLPVGHEVATTLQAPLDVVVVRKIGAPGHREYALGAIGEGDVEVLDDAAIARLGVDRSRLRAVLDEERGELARRVTRYRGDRHPVDVTGRTVVLVDDGIATGRTARAACQVVRARGAARVVVAAPVASPRAVAELRSVADEVVALQAPPDFLAVGTYYRDFRQTSDDEVVRLLAARPDR